MNTAAVVVILLAILNLPAYLLIRRLYFADWDELLEALRYWFTPDMWSFFRGEFFDDWWAELKLGLYIATCTALVGGEFALLMPLITRIA